MDLLRSGRNLILFEGIIFTILGILAVSLPIVTTLAASLFLGWFLIIGGAIQGYRAFTQHIKGSSFYLTLLSAALNIILGILLLTYPIAGILSLTLLLIVFFLLQGIAQIILAFKIRAARGWYWLLINGILALILALIIWSGWPETAFWVIGLLIGINLIFTGISLIFLALGMDNINPNSHRDIR